MNNHVSSLSVKKSEDTTELERLRVSLVQSESIILKKSKARQLLADENLALTITMKESEGEKTRMTAKRSLLKEKLKKNKVSLKLTIGTISDAK